MLTFLVLPAFALVEAKPSCDFATVSLTVPRSGQGDVPTDARVAFVSTGACSHPESYTVALTRADDGEGVYTEAIAWGDASAQGLFELFPGTLPADTELVYTITPDDGWGEAVEVGFSTGRGTVAGLDGAPSLALLSTSFDRQSSFHTVEYDAEAAPDPDNLSLLLVEAHGAAETFSLFAAGSGGRQEFWSGSAGELCLSIAQIDGLGQTVTGNEDCMESTAALCGTTSGGASAALALLALGLVARRR